MLPEIWGRHAWNFLHLVTLGYPEDPMPEDMIRYKKYMDSFQQILPCEKCRKNVKKHMKSIPLTEEILSSKKLFIKWGIDFHNIVNYYTGKKMLTYPEAISELEKLTKTSSNKDNYLMYSMVVVIIILISYVIYEKYNQK